MVCEAPDVSVPRLQGNPPEQGAVADTKVSPAGVGSLRVTAAASDGPPLNTWMLKVVFVPGVKGEPLLVTVTSASGLPVVTDVELLLVMFGSPEELETVAVLEMVPEP